MLSLNVLDTYECNNLKMIRLYNAYTYVQCLDRTWVTWLVARGTRPHNLCSSPANSLDEVVNLGKVGTNHVGLSNTKIYFKESLPDWKRENLRCGGSRSKMVFFQAQGSILNIQLIIYSIRWSGILGREVRKFSFWGEVLLHLCSNLGGSNDLYYFYLNW